MKKSHSEVIIVALLTLLMTFMEMTALPAAIFCDILFLGYRADILLNKLGKLTFSFIDDGKLGFVEGMMENCRKTERERMTNGESFFTNDPQLMEDKKNARILCSRFNSSPEDESLRKALLKQLFGHCGERIAIKPPFHCDYGYNIFAGDDLFINFDCVFLDAAPIRIGEHCMIGPKTCVYAIGHPLDAESRREKIGIPKPVTIGDNVWIGGGVTILPGVSIGDSTVIAAASVVTKSFPDHVVIAGNPAKIIKNIEE